jgi:hydrogenase maturation protease
MRNSVALIGLGNILLKDEGVGVHAVEALQRRYDLPEGVRLIDGGTLGLDLLPLIEGVEKILFVDAMDLKKEPGAIAVIEDQEIPSLLEPKLSLHHVGLSDLLFASRFMGNQPAKMALVGIQPETMEVGLELSPVVLHRFEELLQTVVEKLREWGLEVKEKTVQEPAYVPGHSV